MTSKYIDLNTLKFQLYNALGLDEVLQKEHFAQHDADSMNMFLDAVKDYSDNELYPIFREMDQDPARFEDGKIITHPFIGRWMKEAGEMGLISAPAEEKNGGMQIPLSVYTAAFAIIDAANNNMSGYVGLTLGAADLINAFGTEELKETYVPNMFDGKWGGTMCLTEPQAGSSLSDVTTSATPQEDGSYHIKGQKIFISGGDHELCENFVHLVLARIDGAPVGTKGISLFVVPKNRITDSGLEYNDVTTAGDFQKMGQRGYCTTHLIFGEKDDCQGWLVGAPNRGLKYMFQMMNAARIAVGRGGAAVASAAYYASLEYANERPQGRLIQDTGRKNANAEQTLIINHPDVRRMLLLQKALMEGSMAIVLQAAVYEDLMMSATSEDEKNKYDLLTEILMPIVKTYPTEKGIESITNGLQILGGYGFCSEYVLQQYYRDIRIYTLYEGTTGIQSLDLLGRKMTMNDGRGAQLLAQEINKTIMAAISQKELAPFAKTLGANLQGIAEMMNHLTAFAAQGKYNRFLSDATIFMDYMSTIVIGWQWLKMAVAAQKSLNEGDTQYPKEFYESKIHTMRFFYKYEMTKTSSLADILKSEEVLTLVGEEEVIM